MVERYAKYPFMEEVSGYLKQKGPALDELLHDELYQEARKLGEKRVVNALEQAIVSAQDLTITGLLSWVVARIIVSAVNDTYLINRYSLAEAKGVCKRLRYEPLDFIFTLYSQLGVQVVRENKGARIHFTDYLMCSRRISGDSWKLTNRRVVNGWIWLGKQDLIRIFQELLRDKIRNELPLSISKSIRERFSNEVRRIRGRLSTRKEKYTVKYTAKKGKFPPCIERLLRGIRTGENVPHHGRFALTAFLHGIGMRRDDILAVFEESPDFDHKKALYQIKHITGEISGTTYKVPQCTTMRTYGLCSAKDELCAQVNHPLSYYRGRFKRRE